jgi:hypothetical protein
MVRLALALLLFAVPVLAQDAPAPDIETVHSDALRLDVEVETVRVRSHWLLAGSRRTDYEADTQTVSGAALGEALHYRAKPDAATDEQAFGTLMQMIPVGSLAGKRVRLSARIRSDGVRRALLWMRNDLPNGGGSPTFYNMDDRPIRGTNDWKTYEIVLDVPGDVSAIGFGVVLGQGRGQVWADSFRFESVSKEIPVSYDGICCDHNGRGTRASQVREILRRRAAGEVPTSQAPW